MLHTCVFKSGLFLPFDRRKYCLGINNNLIHNNHKRLFFPFQFDDRTLFLLQHQFCNNYNYLKPIRSNKKKMELMDCNYVTL